MSSDRVAAASVDKQQARHFDALADEWWTPSKGFRQLNRESTLRQDYIRKVLSDSGYLRRASADGPLAGLAIADVGCGGGFVAEPLARWGAQLTGIDIGPATIGAARRHAAECGLAIEYLVGAAEDLAATGREFDVVVALEVAEHVADVNAFLGACTRLVRPGGLLFVSSINRTVRSALTVIIGAEWLLRWIPRGTHRYSMLVRPEEIDATAENAGFQLIDHTGCKFDLRSKSWLRITSEAGSYIRAYRRSGDGAEGA